MVFTALATEAGTSKKSAYERFVRELFARRFLLPQPLGRMTLPVPVILNRFAALLRVFYLGTVCSTLSRDR